MPLLNCEVLSRSAAELRGSKPLRRPGGPSYGIMMSQCLPALPGPGDPLGHWRGTRVRAAESLALRYALQVTAQAVNLSPTGLGAQPGRPGVML